MIEKIRQLWRRLLRRFSIRSYMLYQYKDSKGNLVKWCGYEKDMPDWMKKQVADMYREVAEDLIKLHEAMNKMFIQL